MKTHPTQGRKEHWRTVALDLLAERETLAGLAHLNHVSIRQILAWKERLVLDLTHPSRGVSAA